MFINYNISEIISQLSSAIHYDESIVKILPDGKLNCTHNGRYIKWFLSDVNNISYIHKKDRQLASKLALKKFLLSRIEDNKRLLATYKQCNSTNIQSELLLKDNDFRKLLTDYPENCKHIYIATGIYSEISTMNSFSLSLIHGCLKNIITTKHTHKRLSIHVHPAMSSGRSPKL